MNAYRDHWLAWEEQERYIVAQRERVANLYQVYRAEETELPVLTFDEWLGI